MMIHIIIDGKQKGETTRFGGRCLFKQKISDAFCLIHDYIMA